MACEEHLKVLNQGAATWNEWRQKVPEVTPMLLGREYDGRDLSGYDLSNSNLNSSRLIHCNLSGVDLSGTNLGHANLRSACLEGANLQRADVSDTRISWADLRRADLSRADLRFSDFTGSNLAFANLENALLMASNFCDVDLSTTKGLNNCKHIGLSFVDHRTILRSKNVPLRFWRGCGLTDRLIDNMRSLTDQAIQFYSCFISYSSKDHEFAERLYADLQNNDVPCWYAPHDLPIGEKVLDGIDDAIRLREKVVLILSKDAIASDWVEDEITIAFEEERRRKEDVLLPVRLDDAVIKTSEPWANKVRARNIGDFTKWKEHDSYMVTFQCVLSALKADR